MDLKKFRNTAVNLCDLKIDQPILAGVSGGADSLCLADLLIKCGYMTIIAHFDHKLRDNSGGDAKLVKAFAESRKTPFILGGKNIREFSKRGGYSIEEGARIARYEFLFDQANKLGSGAIAVGHNADDQAETVLMHFLRGAGVNGLRGMMHKTYLPQFNEKIPLVRPLLRIPRIEIEIYCIENEIQFTRDESNFELTYFRNRIRLELMPLLETYQPGIRERLGKTSILMAEVDEVLSDLIKIAWNRVLLRKDSGYVVLSLPAFKREPLAVKRGLIREAIQFLRPGLRNVDFDCVERVVNLVNASSRFGRGEILQGLEALIETDQLVIKDSSVKDTGQYWFEMDSNLTLIIPESGGEISSGNWVIKTEKKSHNKENYWEDSEGNSHTAYLDLDQLKFPILVRTWRSGDRIQPFGMDGHSMKLADFWLNEGLPQRARANWPLVCDQQGICWIPGFRIMHPYQVYKTTKNVLVLEILRS